MTVTARETHRVYEGLVSHLYRTCLGEGGVFLDVGANIGHHTWQMALAVGETGSGVAIEPVPALAKRVKTALNHKEISWVDIVELAVSDTPGSAEFYFRPSHIGWSSLHESHRHPDDGTDDLEVLNVSIATLDGLFADSLPALDFVKLDIEHSEFKALRGGESLIRRTQPVLVFENSPVAAARVNGYSLEEFVDFFEALRYSLYDIFLEPVSAERLLEGLNLPSYYVALPEHHPGNENPREFFDIENAREQLESS